MKAYFGYIRVSTAKQGEQGVSLQEQTSAITRYAEHNSLAIVQWFEERETAAKRGRPIFNEMLRLVKQGKAHGVVIHKIDRGARNLRDWADLGELIDAGIEVHFANESLDLHTRGGRLSADIQAVVAADYIRNLREETRKGFYGRIKQGVYPLPAPLGYLDRGAGRPKDPDPVRAPLVKRTFALYASGRYNLEQLLDETEAMGLRNRRGKPLSMNGLSVILNNPFYLGLIRLKRSGETFQGAHPPLIPKSLFDRVQLVLQGKMNARSQTHEFRFRRLGSTSTYNNGAWHHAVLTLDIPSATAKLYVDGSQVGSTITCYGAQSFTGYWRIGSYKMSAWPVSSDGYFTGSVQEVRYSSIARSSDWILTEYRNQSSPGTFETLGSQENLASQVAAPSFTQNGTSVTITDATSGAAIYYTTDGSVPTSGSTLYSGPITLTTSTYGTSYTYDLLDHLTVVSMPRASGTQTRTFNYGTPPTGFLQSATNPENGTVSYTYDSNNRLSTVVDAKNQKKAMTYDSYNRVTQVSRYYGCNTTCTEDTQQRTNFYYDTKASFDTTNFSQNVQGRLAAVQYHAGHCTTYTTPKAGCDLVQEMYTYSSAGSMLGKLVQLTRSGVAATLTASWTYDNEGRMTGVTYPSWTPCTSPCTATPGSAYAIAYDSMGRLNTLTDTLNTQTLISGATYGVANELQQITSGTLLSVNSETHSYNSLFQLTRLTVQANAGTALDIEYGFSSTQNNGKLSVQTDLLSGEQIVYAYDALNRLASAQTTANPNVTQWGQSYNYDGFGNLTDQNVISGSVPTMHVVYNASTNRQTGDTADANGNILYNGSSSTIYDIDNRLIQPGGTTADYGYDASNKRVWRGDTNLDEFTFWGVGGQKMATYGIVSTGGFYFSMTTTNVYFGGKLIAKGKNWSQGQDRVQLNPIAADRLGSIGKFYPYGQERPSATQNDTEKFTGYYRDASTGLDYADQRYHQDGVGRFMTPDPYMRSARLRIPGSWDRYTYAEDDPINRIDQDGLVDWNLFWQGVRNVGLGGAGIAGTFALDWGTGGLAALATAAVTITATGAATTGFAQMLAGLATNPGTANNAAANQLQGALPATSTGGMVGGVINGLAAAANGGTDQQVQQATSAGIQVGSSLESVLAGATSASELIGSTNVISAAASAVAVGQGIAAAADLIGSSVVVNVVPTVIDVTTPQAPLELIPSTIGSELSGGGAIVDGADLDFGTINLEKAD